MSEIIDTIKNSKVIVVLLILYTVIAIGVVIMDRSIGGKKKEDTKKSTVMTEENIKKFSTALVDLYEDIDEYVVDNNVQANTCIMLSEILDDEDVQGSVYVSSSRDSYNVWFTKYGLYLNGTPINDWNINKDDFGTSFESSYFNSCGEE